MSAFASTATRARLNAITMTPAATARERRAVGHIAKPAPRAADLRDRVVRRSLEEELARGGDCRLQEVRSQALQPTVDGISDLRCDVHQVRSTF